MNRLKNCLLLFYIFFSQTIYCTTVSGERWELSEEDMLSSVCSNTKTILLLYDAHQRRKSNIEQLKGLLHYLRTKGAGVSLIAEDPNTFNNCKLSWRELSKSVKSYSPPMRNAVSLACHCGILATSVEFRPDTSRLDSEVCIKDIIDTTDEQVAIISMYDDGPLLNEEYKKYVTRYNTIIVPSSRQLFESIAVQNCTLEDINYDQLMYPTEADRIINLYSAPVYLKENILEKRVAKVITDYAREVIDFKILHTLVEHAQEGVEIAVIYAGGYHINAIKPILEKLGYRFSKYPTINYDKNGEIQPLNVAQAFQEMDPTYSSDEQLPKETIDYFFEYKEAEEENPCFRTRSMMKMFIAAADSLRGYKAWKKEYPRLERVVFVTLATGALTVLWCIVNICCKSK